MALTIKVNTSSVDLGVGGVGTTYTDFSPGNDRLIFTQGNLTVAPGQPSPTEQSLISAGVPLTGSEIILSTYLLDDVGSNLLRDIPLMGDLNTQFVLAFDFSAGTASEPVLEVWDDSTFQTISSTMLGSGTPAQSFIKGITTTTNPSGISWVGSALAGAGSGNFLFLNDQNGALSGASILYCNLKVVIPASQLNGFSANPTFVVKWMDNA